ncbi:MAG: cupin domain-containing protein, partial [Pseudomonadota bacterium]
GDLVIVPHGASHCLMSRRFPPEDALPLDTVLEQASYDGKGVLVFGGEGQPDGGGGTQLICGHFSFAPGGRHLIFDLLPDHLHIARYGETAGPWLSETLKMIGAEIEQGLPGSDLIAMRLAETILAHTLRIYLQNATAKGGPLIGFADPHIGRALAAMHADPTRAWTVELLAREAGLSRSGFANRFRRCWASRRWTTSNDGACRSPVLCWRRKAPVWPRPPNRLDTDPKQRSPARSKARRDTRRARIVLCSESDDGLSRASSCGAGCTVLMAGKTVLL